MYDDLFLSVLILETVTLDTPNNVAVFVTDASTKRAPTMCPLLELDKSPIFWLFHTGCHLTEPLMHLYEEYRV
jgi:hypothetical protein